MGLRKTRKVQGHRSNEGEIFEMAVAQVEVIPQWGRGGEATGYPGGDWCLQKSSFGRSVAAKTGL